MAAGYGDNWSAFRHGEVADVDPVLCRVMVTFEELDRTDGWYPVLQQGAGGDKSYWLPSVGERVVCAFYSDSSEEGVCLGSFYRAGNPPPGGAAGKRYVVFPDGSKAEWDGGKLTIVAKGGVEITAGTKITGNVEIQGTLTVSGIVTAADFIES